MRRMDPLRACFIVSLNSGNNLKPAQNPQQLMEKKKKTVLNLSNWTEKSRKWKSRIFYLHLTLMSKEKS